MPFGQKVGSIKDLKKNLERGTGTFIRYIPKNGALTVRFLTEPDEWLSFKEVFDTVRRKSYPVPEEGMPGYPDPDQRVSTRYLVNALDTETDKVIPLQLPKDLVNQLVIRYERDETMLDRDYELFRTGEGLDTTYGLTPEAAMARKVDKYTHLDLEQVLQDAYEAVWGSSIVTEGAIKKKGGTTKTKVGGGKAMRRKKIEVDDEPEGEETSLADLAVMADGDDDVDAIEAITTMADTLGVDVEDYETWSEVVDAIADNDDESDEEEVDEEPDDEEEEDDDEEGDEYTEDDYKAMTIGEVRAIAREAGIKTIGMKKGAIISALLALGEDDEDMEEEPF